MIKCRQWQIKKMNFADIIYWNTEDKTRVHISIAAILYFSEFLMKLRNESASSIMLLSLYTCNVIGKKLTLLFIKSKELIGYSIGYTTPLLHPYDFDWLSTLVCTQLILLQTFKSKINLRNEWGRRGPFHVLLFMIIR